MRLMSYGRMQFEPPLKEFNALGCPFVRELARMDLTTLRIARPCREVKQAGRAAYVQWLGKKRAEIATARRQSLAGGEVPVASGARREMQRALFLRMVSRCVLAHGGASLRPRGAPIRAVALGHDLNVRA